MRTNCLWQRHRCHTHIQMAIYQVILGIHAIYCLFSIGFPNSLFINIIIDVLVKEAKRNFLLCSCPVQSRIFCPLKVKGCRYLCLKVLKGITANVFTKIYIHIVRSFYIPQRTATFKSPYCNLLHKASRNGKALQAFTPFKSPLSNLPQ